MRNCVSQAKTGHQLSRGVRWLFQSQTHRRYHNLTMHSLCTLFTPLQLLYSSDSKHPYQRCSDSVTHTQSIKTSVLFPSVEVWVRLLDTNCSNQVSRVLKVAWLNWRLLMSGPSSNNWSLFVQHFTSTAPQLHRLKRPQETSLSSFRWKPDDGTSPVDLLQTSSRKTLLNQTALYPATQDRAGSLLFVFAK